MSFNQIEKEILNIIHEEGEFNSPESKYWDGLENLEKKGIIISLDTLTGSTDNNNCYRYVIKNISFFTKFKKAIKAFKNSFNNVQNSRL